MIEFRETRFKDAIEPSRFVEVTSLSVWDLLRSIHHKVIGLTLHRAHTAMREEEPLQQLAVFLRVLGRTETKLVLLVEFGSEVEQDSTGFEDGEAVVGDGRDTSIRVDFQIPRRLDLVMNLADVAVSDRHRDSFVWNTELFQEDRDRVAIGSRRGVENNFVGHCEY